MAGHAPSRRSGRSAFLTRSVVLACTIAPGCGSDDQAPNVTKMVACELETRDDTFVPGLEKVASGGMKVRLVEAEPRPPAKGDNVWTVEVIDAAGAPVEGASLRVTPFMPDHNHGTSIKSVTTPLGGGRYKIAPVNLFMPSLWEVRFFITPTAGAVEYVVFAFCIQS